MKKIECCKNKINNIEIPTGYDMGLSYMEQLGCINAKLNEVIKYVNEINSGGGDTVINNYYNTTQFPEVAEISPIGRYQQAYGNVGYAQGMCVVEMNGEKNIVLATASDTAPSQSVTIISDLLNSGSGRIKAQAEFSNLGHCNSLTSDGEYIYIACGGGNPVVNQIAKLNLQLELVNIYTYDEGVNPYGIAYNKNKFFVIGANSRLYITENLESLGEEITIEKRNNTTVQGIVADDEYIFLPNGNWWTNYPSTSEGDYGQERCVNYIDVYTHRGEFVKSIIINCPTEIEEFDFTENGNIVILSNAINSCVILKSALYGSLENFDSQNNQITVPQVFTDKSYNVYIGGSPNGIRQEGTERFPFDSFNMMYYGMPNNVTNLNINLVSDINQRLTPRGMMFGKLYIYGNNHVIQGGMRSNNEKIICNNVIFEAINRTDEVVRCDGGEITFNNCTFKYNTTNSYCVYLDNNNVVFNNATFSRSMGASTTAHWTNIFSRRGSVKFKGELIDGNLGSYDLVKYECEITNINDCNLFKCTPNGTAYNQMESVFYIGNMNLDEIISVYNTPLKVGACTNKPDTSVILMIIYRTANDKILRFAYSAIGKIYMQYGIVSINSTVATLNDWIEI